MAKAPRHHVSTDELVLLSRRLGNSDNTKLGRLLGFDPHTVEKVTRESTDDGALQLLTKFRDEQPIGADIRALLARRIEAEFPEESNALKNQDFIIDSLEDPSSDGLNENLLVRLADDIEIDSHLESLGRSLGFSRAEINRYVATNRLMGRVTSKGTYDMLCDWRQKVISRDQHVTLKRALQKAELNYLADRYLRTIILQEDLESLSIVPNFSVSACRRRLIDCYKRGICKVQIKPWDKTSIADVKDIYTVVTMSKKDTCGYNIGEHAKVILQGSVDDVFRTKVNGMLPSRIVIYAGAGKGKSMAVAKLAYDWAYRVKGSALEDLPLLFVLKLRNVDHNLSLGQAILSELLVDVNHLTPKLLEAFIRDHQDLCWIILDGLDEYSGDFSTEAGTTKSNILRILQNKDLTQVRLLVTCRPHLEKDFQYRDLPKVYAKMEIEGFSAAYTRKYIDNFFVDDCSKGQRLKMYLVENDIISELVSTPLFCLMVCTLWREGLMRDINTQTKLFDTIVHFLWLHIKEKSPRYTSSWLSETMKHLGKVALAGLLSDSNKLLFVDDDFKNYPAALSSGIELGMLLESTPSLANNPLAPHHTVKRLVEFFHQSAQEHAAGKYISSMHSETAWVRKKLGLSKLDFLLKEKRKCIGEYENLLRFIAGTNADMCILTMNAILSNASLDESERFRILLDLSTEAHSFKSDVSALLTQHLPQRSVVLKSPTLYTIAGMKTLPDPVKDTITSIEIQTARLTEQLPRRLTDGLTYFPNLREVTIAEPTPVDSLELPHITHVRHLKLLSLPPDCDGWEWLRTADGLAEIEVSSRHPESSESSEKNEKVHIAGNKARIKAARSELMFTVLKHLPSHLQDKVKYVEIKMPQLTSDLQVRLSDGLRCLHNMEEVTITDPTKAGPLPHLPNIRCLKLLAFPLDWDGWEWLGSARNLEEVLVLTTRPKSSDEGERIHIKGNTAVTNSSQSAVLANVFKSLPLQMDLKVTSLEITSPKLTVDQSSLLSNVISYLPSLTEVTIRDPTKVDSLLHLHNIRSLKLLGLPRDCQDWEWLRSTRLLEELTVQTVADFRGEREAIYVGRGTVNIAFAHSPLAITILETLPSHMEDKITSLSFEYIVLSQELSVRLWSSLDSLSSLTLLEVKYSRLSLSSALRRLPSVRELKATHFPSASYSGLLKSLSGLKVITVLLNDAGSDIDQIASGLDGLGGRNLAHIELYGLGAQSGEVRTAHMTRLGEVIRRMRSTTKLQTMKFCHLQINEESLISFVEACRPVLTLQHITIWRCGVTQNGLLHSHLKTVEHPRGSLKIILDNGCRYNISLTPD